MTCLAGDGPRAETVPTNVYFWLAEAYRQGVGVPVDLDRAHRFYVHASVLGYNTSAGEDALDFEDWGGNPGDDLTTAVARPENKAILLAEVQNGNSYQPALTLTHAGDSQADQSLNQWRPASGGRDDGTGDWLA